MNFFFLPRLNGLEGFVTLTNAPPAGTPSDDLEQIVHVIWSDGDVWHVRDLAKLAPGQAITLNEYELPRDCPPEHEASLFFFLSAEKQPAVLDALPTDGRPDTVPAWRSNIGLRSQKTSVSYQGEYPEGMVKIPKGSLVSFTPFIQLGPEIDTKLVMVNLRHAPARENRHMHFAQASDNRPFVTLPVRENSISIVSLKDVLPHGAPQWITYSGDMTGIPLYLSHNKDFTQMSFEHTHPPIEMAVFGDRIEVQKNLKAWWLEHLQEMS
jgi:hypothetical protein